MLYNKQVQLINHDNVIKPHLKWEEVFNNLHWKNIHSLPFKSTIDTKLRSFQYKYIMRILPTNQFLSKCNIISLCDFCNRQPETLDHLFWECHFVRAFWIHNFCIANNQTFYLCYETISFGLYNSSSFNLLNCIILLAKYFIFRSKYLKTIPSVSAFIPYLHKTKQIERLIAINKNKVRSHEIKWGNL